MALAKVSALSQGKSGVQKDSGKRALSDKAGQCHRCTLEILDRVGHAIQVASVFAP